MKKENIIFENPNLEYINKSYLDNDKGLISMISEVKIIIYNLELLVQIEKFININSKLIQNKIILFDFKKDSVSNKIKNLKKFAEIFSKNYEQKFYLENKWIKGKTLNYKITIDDMINIFVYGNKNDREIYSNKEYLKLLMYC
jgi:hypothetical protein